MASGFRVIRSAFRMVYGGWFLGPKPEARLARLNRSMWSSTAATQDLEFQTWRRGAPETEIPALNIFALGC